jgi:hypothetical protein
MKSRWQLVRAIMVLAPVAVTLFAQDVVSYQDLKGIQFREYQMVMTIDSFDCEAIIGKKCRRMEGERRGWRRGIADNSLQF